MPLAEHPNSLYKTLTAGLFSTEVKELTAIALSLDEKARKETEARQKSEEKKVELDLITRSYVFRSKAV